MNCKNHKRGKPLFRVCVALISAITFAAADAAAQKEDIQQQRQGIVATAEVSIEDRERLGLLSLSDRCSASLLRNNWAITAAHCVDDPNPARPGEFMTNSADSVTLTANWREFQERRAALIVSFRPLDIAIIRVTEPFSVGGSTRAYNRDVYRGSLKNLRITAYGRGIFELAQGFGTTATPARSDGRYRVANFIVDQVEERRYSFPSAGGAMVAGGDSGGPSFTRVASGDLLVGVHSTARVVCLLGKKCGDGDWDWVMETPRAHDAPASAVWDDIDRYLGAFVPEPLPKEIPGGRVRLPPGTPPSPPRPICTLAREARARNSPAALGLEGQCVALINSFAARGEAIADQDPLVRSMRARQPDDSARRGFDIGMGAAEGQTADGPGKQSIRDSLPPAEQVGFAAAVSFSLARNSDLGEKRNEEFAARGVEVTNRDPLAVELRDRMREGGMRRGFDIGMGAAEGQTEWGPGKQRLLDFLPGRAEREGFKVATSFSLERNRYADRAARGAAIAAADPVVAEARNTSPRTGLFGDVFWRLGFDIATAIFGNPALGAQGNTAMGPGSTGIRNSLSPDAQAGFDAAVKLHLSRQY